MNAKMNFVLRIALGAGLILLALFSTLPMLPPRAVPSDAPATRFSAERAMADLEVVAREPHGAGSEAQQRVRDYIVGQVGDLGLSAEIESGGRIANILVRLAGSDATQTVLVTGHYDSHPPAPGAGDNGLSTVAMLETMRVLQANPPLRNDILFLFTDGEELGYLGASTFLLLHPQAQDEIGVVLCFDGVPGNAPLTLRQTSPGDAWLVGQMTGLRLSMFAGSWTNRDERGEIDCDCSIFDNAGLPTLEMENEHAGTRYHSANDTVEAISPRLVQSYGQTMIALTNHFGSIDLRTRRQGPDVTYFSLPLVGIIAHPSWLMTGLSGLALTALLASVVIAWRRRLFSPGRFGVSLLGLLLAIAVIVLIAQFAWDGITDHYAAELTARKGFEASSAWLAGLMIGAAALMVGCLSLLSRPLGSVNLAVSAALVFLAVGFFFYFQADGDHPFTTAWLAWPWVSAVAGVGVLIFTRDPTWKVALLALCALIHLALLVPYLWLGSYTREDAWLPVLVTCVLMCLLAPQAAVLGCGVSTEEGSGAAPGANRC